MSKRNVVHIEISATNVGAASKFYEELLGSQNPSFNK